MCLTKISRFLSLILRHKPEAINIQLDEHGWANVKDLIEGVSESYDFNMSMLEEIVRTDEKERYSFNEGLSRKVCKFIYESLDLNVAHSWG